MSIKVFSLSEANGLIPRLTEVFQALQEARETLRYEARSMGRALRLELNDPRLTEALVEDSASGAAIERYQKLFEDLQAEGIIVRSVDDGLVDFPSLAQNRLIYLCWQMGETEISWWHELDSGFPGRKRLADLFSSSMLGDVPLH
jgi:hypothetical protein